MNIEKQARNNVAVELRDSTNDDSGSAKGTLNDVYISEDLIKDYFRSIGTTALLTAEQEAELSRKIEAGVYAEQILAGNEQYQRGEVAVPELNQIAEEGEAAKWHFVTANLRLAANIAAKFKSGKVPYTDLIQEANFGLIRAVEKFDYKRGFKFSTYATPWIRQFLGRMLSNEGGLIRLPVHVGETNRRIGRKASQLTHELGRTPTDDELMAVGDFTATEVKQYWDTHNQDPVSLNMKISDNAELGDILGADRTQDPIDAGLEEMDIKRRVAALLDELSEREKEVLMWRFGLADGEPKTLKDVGLTMGVTSERIRQIEQKALERLRQGMPD